jgi:hypothetical protein
MRTLLFVVLSVIAFYTFVGIFDVKKENELVCILIVVLIGILLNINYKMSKLFGRHIQNSLECDKKVNK